MWQCPKQKNGLIGPLHICILCHAYFQGLLLGHDYHSSLNPTQLLLCLSANALRCAIYSPAVQLCYTVKPAGLCIHSNAICVQEQPGPDYVTQWQRRLTDLGNLRKISEFSSRQLQGRSACLVFHYSVCNQSTRQPVTLPWSRVADAATQHSSDHTQHRSLRMLLK